MSKKVKSLIIDEMKSRFQNVHEFVIVSMRGIDGIENNTIRDELGKKGIRLTVVKNSLASRAFSDLGMPAVSEILAGPCTVAYGGESIVDVAKELVEWNKKQSLLEIKGGYLEGQVLDAGAAVGLSKMPSRAELQAMVVMITQSPARKLASVITSPAGVIAGCLKTIIDKQEKAA